MVVVYDYSLGREGSLSDDRNVAAVKFARNLNAGNGLHIKRKTSTSGGALC